MLHTRNQILENQAKFHSEITDFLKKELSATKKELKLLKSEDVVIKEAKNNLIKKSNKVNNKEIEQFFFSFKNLYPKFYAWWDEENEEVIKCKYKT